MTANAQGTLVAGNPLRDPEEQLAEIRQKIVDGLHLCIKDAQHSMQFPDIMERAIINRIWAHPRRYGQSIAPAMKLMDFVSSPYPRGLGTTVDVIERLIAGDERVMLAWDQALRDEPRAAPNPSGTNQHTKAPTQAKMVRVDNININQNAPGRPDGTSAQYGIRRLDKAAQAGDEKAADMLRRVLDPNDPTTVNSAAVVMGWRRPMISVVNTNESITDAAVKNGGPLKTVQRAWAKATQIEREEIAAWVDDQMSPLRKSRLGR